MARCGQKVSGDSKEVAKMRPGVDKKVSEDSKEMAKMLLGVGQRCQETARKWQRCGQVLARGVRRQQGSGQDVPRCWPEVS